MAEVLKCIYSADLYTRGRNARFRRFYDLGVDPDQCQNRTTYRDVNGKAACRVHGGKPPVAPQGDNP